MTLEIEVFPAGYGDALLVSYGEGNNTARILIDGGFASTAKAILRRLDELDAHIDLFSLTGLEQRLAELLGRPVDLLPEPVEKQRLQANIDRDRRNAF